MKIVLIISAVIALVHGQGHNQEHHLANYHAILEMLHHYYLTLDHNHDGCVTAAEELSAVHSSDANGDCRINFSEFQAVRAHVHGPLHPTEEQEHRMFSFYDTRGHTQAADGVYTCDDLPYFFGYMDFNADHCLSESEFDQAMQSLASAISGVAVHTTLAPSTAAR